jgi:carbon storage regulator|tara:strand:- start:1007 stop:1192 length:186 start_codon:yes stop_codon:yes gene_type:complete
MGLSLSRKVGDKIYIGTDVELEIIRVKGGKVIICIEAPDDTRILRGEVKERDDEQNKTAIR